jgi:predicted Zn-dependent protease
MHMGTMSANESAKEQSQARLRAAFAQALATLRAGRAVSAEQQLRAIQAAAPGDVNSLSLLGVALLAQDKVLPAIEALEKVIAAAPAFQQTRTDLARAYRQGRRLESAREEIRKVVAAAPGLDSAWLTCDQSIVDILSAVR